MQRPNSFQVPNTVVDLVLTQCSLSEMRVLFYAMRQVQWDRANRIALSSRKLANALGYDRTTVQRAIDKLIELNIFEEREGEPGEGKTYGFVLDSDDEGVADSTQPPLQRVSQVADSTQPPSLLDSSNTESTCKTKIRKNDVLRDSSSHTSYEKQPAVAPVVESVMPEVSELPLRVRFLTAVSRDIFHTVPSLENEVGENTSPSSEGNSNGVPTAKNGWVPRDQYQYHIGLLYGLWSRLFGTSTRPTPKTMATLISRYGGYKGGGTQRLGLAMLRLAHLDTDPTTLLFSSAIKAKKEDAQFSQQFNTYAHSDIPVIERRGNNGFTLD